jgi:hypothetical protein
VVDEAPVIEISGRFRDADRARAVAEAMNRWFRWIVDGSFEPMPSVFDDLGVPSREFSWALEEDVDWNLGPHARAVAEEVRIAIQTSETHLRVAGLLRRLGAKQIKVVRETP